RRRRAARRRELGHRGRMGRDRRPLLHPAQPQPPRRPALLPRPRARRLRQPARFLDGDAPHGRDAARQPAPPAPLAGDIALTMRSDKQSVLVVEDDGDLANSLAEVLTEAGYAVRVAANGRAALERLAERRPDLMLLDLKRPEKS